MGLGFKIESFEPNSLHSLFVFSVSSCFSCIIVTSTKERPSNDFRPSATRRSHSWHHATLNLTRPNKRIPNRGHPKTAVHLVLVSISIHCRGHDHDYHVDHQLVSASATSTLNPKPPKYKGSWLVGQKCYCLFGTPPPLALTDKPSALQHT